MSLPERTHANSMTLTPTDSTPVFDTRPLNPKANTDSLPVFGDDYWRLAAALFEAHATQLGLNYADMLPPYKRISKAFNLLLIKYETPPQILHERAPARLSIPTIIRTHRLLKRFFQWLSTRQVSALTDLTQADFDDFLAYIRTAPWSTAVRVDCMAAVQLFWAYRDLLPPEGRLPVAPWDGKKPGYVLTVNQSRPMENTTPRIQETVMQLLLVWAIRFIEDFADDIVAAHSEFQLLCNRHARGRRKGLSRVLGHHGRAGRDLRQEVRQLFDAYEASGRPLPGRLDETGQLYLNLSHLSRVLDCNANSLTEYTSWLKAEISRRQLELVDGAPLHDRVTGQIDGVPWRSTRITYTEIGSLARHLSTAACIVIAHLSGMRPGEVLNLERGCAKHDSVTGLDFVHGRKFKGARGSDGAKLPEGEVRRNPWTVIPVVTRAIALVESLHDRRLLFPSCLYINGRVLRGKGEMARTSSHMNRDIQQFITWVNMYCADHGRVDHIPPDPKDRQISLSRFRRTLAWFICHRPRGLVAAAIQYGHVQVSITQGYAGNAASGFPDVYAFEEALGKVQQAVEDQVLLRQGEQVSGPAAPLYRERTEQAAKEYQGEIFPTERHARRALNNPVLHVFHAESVTCVFDPDKALCILLKQSDDPRRTPDLNNCRSTCKNIAITDRNIVLVRRRLAVHEADAHDPLAPEPLRKRAAALAEKDQAIIDAHVAHQVQSSEERNP